MSKDIKPMLFPREENYLRAFLKPNMQVFEWGCGGSTINLSKLVSRWSGIEHDAEWYETVKAQAPRNAQIFFAPPDRQPPRRPSQYDDYRTYVSMINKFLPNQFDAIFVDGRCRVDCAIVAIPYLKKEGHLLLHDFGRKRYKRILEYYSIVDSVGTFVILKPRKENNAVFNSDTD